MQIGEQTGWHLYVSGGGVGVDMEEEYGGEVDRVDQWTWWICGHGCIVGVKVDWSRSWMDREVDWREVGTGIEIW